MLSMFQKIYTLKLKCGDASPVWKKKYDAEYFYSNYFSTIVKECEKYFLNIEKSASTLLASRLADKLQENKHKRTFQIPCTFVPNCGERTQFLFFERSGTARPFLDSCFVTIWLNPFRSLKIFISSYNYAWKRILNDQLSA